MYKKILVPLDGSHRSMAAAEHAVRIASDLDAEITLFHVAPNMPLFINNFDPRDPVYETITREVGSMGEKILTIAENEFKDVNVKIVKKLAWGNPAQQICAEAEDGHYDLIVIGSRGMGEIKGYLMGSVSNRVTRHAKCPVMIIR